MKLHRNHFCRSQYGWGQHSTLYYFNAASLLVRPNVYSTMIGGTWSQIHHTDGLEELRRQILRGIRYVTGD